MFSQKSFLLAIALSFFFLGNIFAQSSVYESSTELVSVQLDSLTTEQRIQLTINFTDINLIGGIAFSVYDSQDGSFLFEMNSTISDMQTAGMLTGSRFRSILLPFQSGKNIRIDINPFYLDGAFLENQVLTTNF